MKPTVAGKFHYSIMLTNEPRSSSVSVLEDLGGVCTSREVGHHVEQIVLGVADDLHIDGMILLVVQVREGIWRGCLNAHVDAVDCARVVGQASYHMESP